MPGNFAGVCGSRVGADRPDEISFDASVPLRRRDGLVGGLDPVIGLGHLLPQSVVRHQRLDNRCRRQTAYRKSLHAVHKGAAADLAVNKEVIEFYGLARQFGFRWLHWLTPFQREYHVSPGLIWVPLVVQKRGFRRLRLSQHLPSICNVAHLPWGTQFRHAMRHRPLARTIPGDSPSAPLSCPIPRHPGHAFEAVKKPHISLA